MWVMPSVPLRPRHEGHGVDGCFELAVREPLTNDAVILPPALLRAEGAEVNVLAVERDDRLAGGFVVTVGRVSIDESGGMVRLLLNPDQTAITVLAQTFRPHCPTRTDTLNKAFGRIYFQSGRRDSNPQQLAWKASALPLSYAREVTLIIGYSSPPEQPLPPRASKAGILRTRSATCTRTKDARPRKAPSPLRGGTRATNRLHRCLPHFSCI
jgi:hypothetical protein